MSFINVTVTGTILVTTYAMLLMEYFEIKLMSPVLTLEKF